jgi:hypothetical protein
MRENLIAAAGPTSQSYLVANPNGSETRRRSTEPVPVSRLPRMTATARLKAPSWGEGTTRSPEPKRGAHRRAVHSRNRWSLPKRC